MKIELLELEEKINELHKELNGLFAQSIDKAIEIGKLLTEKKDELQHGEFIPWIKKNLVFTDRTARNYMRIYDNKDKVLNAGSVFNAYKMLEAPKTESTFRFAHLIPENNEMIEIVTDSQLYNFIYIIPHESAGFYKRFWESSDQHEGITLNGDIRGCNKERLIKWLNQVLINEKNMKYIKTDVDKDLLKMFQSVIK